MRNLTGKMDLRGLENLIKLLGSVDHSEDQSEELTTTMKMKMKMMFRMYRFLEGQLDHPGHLRHLASCIQWNMSKR